MGRPPSMVDVAREAGVAHVTVSRVLNAPDSVRPETRQRVLAAIDRLGYRRNDVARALKSGQTMTLGVVLAGAELFELARMLFGLETTASGAGYGISLARWQGTEQGALADVIGRLTDRGADGVVAFADRPVAAEALDEVHVGVPLSVVMSGRLSNPAVSTVEIDQDLGARLATRHLLSLGHRHIAHLAGSSATFDAAARLEGWRAEVLAAGLDATGVLHGDLSARSGYELGLRLARTRPRPTAVFAANDAMATGLLAACAEVGLRVPQDLSVVGFDDLSASAYLVPALTTVRQDHFELGRRAADVVLGLMAGEPARHHSIAPDLVERRSTCPPLHPETRDDAQAHSSSPTAS
ncbi:LacI family DNA-binding transcriptional regulator [Kineococcus sp. SYSU DK004]|uniref:LacI family DNA-binding transcriptional regulator n=1 Tax=Kineococcus sp. SYSU DK004 TaxID=3383125 RepID=UPI003D7D8576